MNKKRWIVIFILWGIGNLAEADCVDSRLESLCRNYPERVHTLFLDLNLDYTGLEKVKAAVDQKDDLTACRELLAYYGLICSENTRDADLDTEESQISIQIDANDILKDTFTFQQIKGTVPRKANGGLDWDYAPGADPEWTLFLNRHFHINTLKTAYIATGNRVYFDKINEHLRDWILSSPYEGKGFNHYDGSQKSWRWYALAAASRGSIWSGLFEFYEQLDSDVKILMLSSLAEHCQCLRKFHSGGGNHLLLEMKSLARMAAGFPQFKESQEWFSYSIARMAEELDKQVYPDGVHSELSGHYHELAFRSFNDFSDQLEKADRQIPPAFVQKLIQMADYMAYVQQPNGYGPLNNDSDLCFYRRDVTAASKKYHRDDWTYIVSHGREGKKPDKLSVFYPWAGQVVMRNGWDENAHWLFFDNGPSGSSGHRHFDKLHLSLAAYGRELLVDAGRYTYVGYRDGSNPWRNYFAGSVSHNTILIDGSGQKGERSETALSNAFVSGREYDFARGTYAKGYTDVNDIVVHTRAVAYLQNRFWVVIDHVKTNQPHQIQTLWHWHPDCTVTLDSQSAVSTDEGKANLRIIPISSFDWDVRLVKGQEKPDVQGWYSTEYNKKVPNYAAVYTANITKSQAFAWLLLAEAGHSPSFIKGKILDESEEKVSICIMPSDRKEIFLDIPLIDGVEKFSITHE